MYLSKLELHGFKSFASQTALHFDPGITAIVGPNGCGKSNIVDAVRWVIGEQRARILRSEKMENVIFNGTSKRRPLGMAEVQLTVENTRGVLPTEYTEVTLGRRLFRSGESEYLLNGTPCRLKDIVDLFMDTGMGAGAYSVIELKMIEEILSDNAQDRRHLFEEAAGITKYKQRRTQTLRKLDSTQADLTRLRDLTEEIEKRVRSLKRQANKAARFKEYEGRLHGLELALARVEFDRLSAQEEALRHEIGSLSESLEAHTAQLADDEDRLEALRRDYGAREQDLAQSQTNLNEHLTAVRELEAELRLEQERLDAARRDRERTEREQQEARTRRDELLRHVDQTTLTIEQAEPALQEAERRLEDAQKSRDAARAEAETRRTALRDFRREEQQLSEARAGHQRSLDRLGSRLDMMAQEQARLQDEQATLTAAGQEQDTHAAAAQRRVDEAQQAVDAARNRLAEAQKAFDERQEQLEATSRALQQLERQHDATQAEVHLLESLVSSYDEFSDAVQYLAAIPASWTSNELRTVADVLACDEDDRLALDAALGEHASCFVVETEHEARQAIELLRREQKGRATFVILERLNAGAAGSDRDVPEDARPLSSVVRVDDPRYEPLAATLLHACYLVSSLDDARQLAHASNAPARFFSRTGEWTDADGLVHGGSEQAGASSAASRLGRREQLNQVREHLDVLKADLERLSAEKQERREVLEAVPFAACRDALRQAERTLADAERARTRVDYEQETLTRRRATLQQRQEQLADEIEAGQAEIGPLEQAVAGAEERLVTVRRHRAGAEESYQTAEAASRVAQDHVAEANVAAVEARNKLDNLRRELARTRQEIAVLEQRSEDRKARLAEITTAMETASASQEQLRQQLDDVRSHRTRLEQDVANAKATLFQIKADIEKVEQRLRKLRQAREQTIRDENARAVRQAEIHTRKEDLIESVLEDFGLSLADEDIPIDPDFDEKTARAEVQELRRKVKSLGNVNALALEEYEEEKERLDFMLGQQEDLENAEATLLETIEEINTTAAERFDETYRAIRASFSELFSELFGEEATADLELADPDDPLESPIDIMAKPRGKRPISITQLSSGEKTLTAIALLFAIYLVKPSPFCILDEVDAPLDDANVSRFMRLIRRFSDNTQFILVTHNKHTMEMADRLYGITMQEQGVSKLVGVKFEEALEIAG